MRRTFVRAAAAGNYPSLAPAEVAAALRDALAVDGAVDVLDELAGAAVLAFSLTPHSRGPAVVARSPDGRCLAVCADPLVAARHAFALLDRAAKHQRSARPRPSRARRRPTEKEITR